jgi:hypothetical protein
MHDNIDTFMQQQREKYLSQLQHYAEVLKKMEQRSVRCALYFPLFCGWCEWEFTVSSKISAQDKKSSDGSGGVLDFTDFASAENAPAKRR